MVSLSSFYPWQAQNAASPSTGGSSLSPVTLSLSPSTLNNYYSLSWLSYGFGTSASSAVSFTAVAPNNGNNTVILDTGER